MKLVCCLSLLNKMKLGTSMYYTFYLNQRKKNNECDNRMELIFKNLDHLMIVGYNIILGLVELINWDPGKLRWGWG